ncbi:MAG: DUF4249 domain-containing protein [Bacteroidota bacterium]|nr:DUF4249 domain-containing protein [Bacteroidota bacterium]
MRIRKPINIFVLLLVCFSCIDEYPLDIRSYENLLVIDGMITNQPGPYTVRLSRSASIDYPVFDPVINAKIIIEDNHGNNEQLTEIDDGIYATAPDGMQGVSDRSYRLKLELADGTKYESPYQRMNGSVGIDSVYAKIEYRETSDPDYDLVGYQFYLNSSPSVNDTVYYLWQLEETWEFNSDFTLDYIYEGTISPSGNPYKFYTCWTTKKIPEINCFSTLNQASPQVADYPLTYVSTQSKRLSIRYSLLTRQLTISKEAYKFWNDVKQQISDNELLFDQQPFQIRGNLHNVNEPDEPVMGYFTVAGTSEKRIFVNRPLFVDFDYPVCFPETDLRKLAYTPPRYWPIYLVDTKDGMAIGEKSCFDCRMHDGSLEKPEFWTDAD